jgi:hypothetical protein
MCARYVCVSAVAIYVMLWLANGCSGRWRESEVGCEPGRWMTATGRLSSLSLWVSTQAHLSTRAQLER